MNNFVLVFIGGGVGSVLRYGLSEYFKNKIAIHFPIATFAANVFSCIILGLISIYLAKSPENNVVKPLLAVGLCGGFSTFSTFSYETLNLFKSGNYSIATLNVLLSVAACLLVLFVVSKKI